ncbi:hypothetical protein CRBSH125_01190 [Afipia carboxidovorans]|nr:hypothetical protein CRBSH125_01190 [Afipia carboxidovorans]
MERLTFSVRYDSGLKPFTGLEHYYGAQSLFGVAQILMISLNAFFHREVITQAPAAKGFKIVLGRAKQGSWEQALDLIITSPDTLAVAKDLGKNALYDLIKWALLSGAGLQFGLSYRKAKQRVRQLERENDDIQEKLEEALKRVHSPVKHQGLTVQIFSGRTLLATYDDMTLQYIETEVFDDETEALEVAISRFNARTGTGRLINTIDAVSVPFIPVDKLTQRENTLLADNLAQVARGRFVPIKAIVSKVTAANGHIKRYRMHHALPLT